MKETYVILGIPKAQGRVRFARIGKFVKTYDPEDSLEHKENLRAQVAFQKPVLHNGPLMVNITFELSRPKGHYGKNGLKASAPLFHVSKPDLDNLEKAVLDACKGLCWKDDAQIFMLSSGKRYADAEPKTVIDIYENGIKE